MCHLLALDVFHMIENINIATHWLIDWQKVPQKPLLKLKINGAVSTVRRHPQNSHINILLLDFVNQVIILWIDKIKFQNVNCKIVLYGECTFSTRTPSIWRRTNVSKVTWTIKIGHFSVWTCMDQFCARVISLVWSDFTFTPACVYRDRERRIKMASLKIYTLQNDDEKQKTTKVYWRRIPAFLY